MGTKFTSERRWGSASLDCLRGNARKAGQSCATGGFSSDDLSRTFYN
jgi:hypothetical protein